MKEKIMITDSIVVLELVSKSDTHTSSSIFWPDEPMVLWLPWLYLMKKSSSLSYD